MLAAREAEKQKQRIVEVSEKKLNVTFKTPKHYRSLPNRRQSMKPHFNRINKKRRRRNQRLLAKR